MEDEEKKTLLVEKLGLSLNSSIHTVVDLSLREVSGEQGGLCGIAAIYQALASTVLTKSQLRVLGYEALIELMADEMIMTDQKKVQEMSDAEILMHFYDCKCFIFCLA